jgi:hypothetical protein
MKRARETNMYHMEPTQYTEIQFVSHKYKHDGDGTNFGAISYIFKMYAVYIFWGSRLTTCQFVRLT